MQVDFKKSATLEFFEHFVWFKRFMSLDQ